MCDTKICPAQAQSEIRLKYLAGRIHQLGPAPLYYLLSDIEQQSSGDLRELFEQYAQLPAELIKVYRGDQFAPPVSLIREGGRNDQ
jgi:hypothetical protein